MVRDRLYVKAFSSASYFDAATNKPLDQPPSDPPWDDQAVAWLRKTGCQLVTVSAPSIHRELVGDDRKQVLMITAASLVYRPNPNGIPE